VARDVFHQWQLRPPALHGRIGRAHFRRDRIAQLVALQPDLAQLSFLDVDARAMAEAERVELLVELQ